MSAPVWSPDGTRLAFAAQTDDPGLGGDATHMSIFVWNWRPRPPRASRRRPTACRATAPRRPATRSPTTPPPGARRQERRLRAPRRRRDSGAAAAARRQHPHRLAHDRRSAPGDDHVRRAGVPGAELGRRSRGADPPRRAPRPDRRRGHQAARRRPEQRRHHDAPRRHRCGGDVRLRRDARRAVRRVPQRGRRAHLLGFDGTSKSLGTDVAPSCGPARRATGCCTSAAPPCRATAPAPAWSNGTCPTRAPTAGPRTPRTAGSTARRC